MGAAKRLHLFYSRPGGVDGPGKHTWWFHILPFIADESTVLDNALGTTCHYFAEEVLPPRLAIYRQWEPVRGHTSKAIARVLSRCPNLRPVVRAELARQFSRQAALEARHVEKRLAWRRGLGDFICNARLDARLSKTELVSISLCQAYLKSTPSVEPLAYSYIFQHLLRLKRCGFWEFSEEDEEERRRWVNTLNKTLKKSMYEDGALFRLIR